MMAVQTSDLAQHSNAFGIAVNAYRPTLHYMETLARRLRDAYEPIAMHAVWSPITQAALSELGLGSFQGYVCGRGSVLGNAPSDLVAAAFAVFEPSLIGKAWSARGDLERLVRLRDDATARSLRAVLGDDQQIAVTRVAGLLEHACAHLDVTGRPLFAALRAQARLTDPYARLWRAAEVAREHRGDGHVAVCLAAGLDPLRMNLLTELRAGYPVGEYTDTRGWPVARREAALARLEADGLVAAGLLTETGREFRDGIEDATDAAQDELVAALGDTIEDLIGQLDSWSARCIEKETFPRDERKRAAG